MGESLRVVRARIVPGRVLPPSITDWTALRCLSVQDPWIKLLGTGAKTFELRSRVTHYRGPVVLVSSLRCKPNAAAQRARELHAPWTPAPAGCALYIGQLVDSFPAQRCAEHAMRACCVPSPKLWVWQFERVWTIPRPYFVSGKLGLYRPSRGLVNYLRRVLA